MRMFRAYVSRRLNRECQPLADRALELLRPSWDGPTGDWSCLSELAPRQGLLIALTPREAMRWEMLS